MVIHLTSSGRVRGGVPLVRVQLVRHCYTGALRAELLPTYT